MSDANITLRPESPLNEKTRASGFYWCRVGKDWHICRFANDDQYTGWYIFGSLREFGDSDFSEIDERRITREEPLAAKISGTTERISQNE